MVSDTSTIYGDIATPQMVNQFSDNRLMKITDRIATNIRAWMEASARYKTSKSLSAASGVGATTIDRIKANGFNNNPTIKNLESIASTFGRSVEELISEPNQPTGLEARQPPSPAYLPDCRELLSYLGELDQADAEIFVQQLRLDVLKARKKLQGEHPPPALQSTKLEQK